MDTYGGETERTTSPAHPDIHGVALRFLLEEIVVAVVSRHGSAHLAIVLTPVVQGVGAPF
jgi:hypothetical protein